MIYRPWTLPETWKLILHSLEDNPKSFQELLELGIDREKLKEILNAMIKLNMISQDPMRLRYSLKHKEAMLKC